jgi:YD repeat-containing protein
LNQDGFTTRRGTPWRFEYIASALRTDAQSDKLTAAIAA